MNRLYRRNVNGKPCVWYAEPINSVVDNKYLVYYGIVGKPLHCEEIHCSRNVKDEIKTKYNEKRKQGYKYLEEIKDDTSPHVKGEELFNYLNTYLPYDRTNSDGLLLPMLAKVYDNTNNKMFKKCSYYIGQPKINGLRCFIKAKQNYNDLFKPISLQFQSKEGSIWNSLENLEEYLLIKLPKTLLDKMINDDYVLDGELYLPGYSVNEINHFIKDNKCFENKLIQYWCYDLAIENISQWERIEMLNRYFFAPYISNINTHLNIKERLNYVNNIIIKSDIDSTTCRNDFINLGFEGLILRNPDSEYQFGKRNSAMFKYKTTSDGLFEILDIYKEGVKRDIPLFLCKNDINNNTFEVHINGSMEYQKTFLYNKDKYIGKRLYISFGERSGIDKVPFHVKIVKLYEQ